MLLALAVTALFLERPLTVGKVRYVVRLDAAALKPLQLVHSRRVIDRVLKLDWKPWALQIADVDGDGHVDVAVGIVKRTRYLPQPHTCLWIFGVRDGKFTRKWLGSTMGRPLLEFGFGESEKGGAPLFTLERTLEGKVALSRYRWSGFGFRKGPKEKVWDSANGLLLQHGKIELIGDGRPERFSSEEWK